MLKIFTALAGLLGAGVALAAGLKSGTLAVPPVTVVTAPIASLVGLSTTATATATAIASSTTPAATQWIGCGGEGATCTVSGTVMVRYGVNGTFVSRAVTGTFTCGNAMFGDPAYGVAKSCSYSAIVPTPGEWVSCASENQMCTVPNAAQVRYGAGTAFAYRDVTGTIACTNAMFGDPASGIVKSCAYFVAAPQITAAATISQWIPCASEGQTCLVPGSAQVRYGAGGAFAYRDATGSIVCANASFGDPAYGLPKSCAYQQTIAAADTSSSVELASIPSNFDINQYLVPSWGTGAIPATNKPDVVGAFRFICNPGQVLADDPIVYPGQPGKSHLHQFFGNTAANANSTYPSLRTTGESTCENILNRSAYWIPAMMNGKGKVVRPDYVTIYYKRRPASDPECLHMSLKGCRNLPRGLRYIFGYNMTTNQPGSDFFFNCDGPTATPGHYPDIVAAAKACPVGNRIGVIIGGPECWDGQNLDSPDHRSHMAYPSYGWWGYEKCPDTHPYVIPAFTLGAWYTVDADLDRSGNWDATTTTWRLASDAMPGMAPQRPGTTMHADWFGAWDDSVISMWSANCVDKLLNCSGGDLGNGKQLRMFDGFSWNANPRIVDPPA